MKGIKSGTYDETFRDYIVMKEMHWSWDDLEQVPEFTYLAMLRIMSIEGRERKKESKNAGTGNKLDSKRHRR